MLSIFAEFVQACSKQSILNTNLEHIQYHTSALPVVSHLHILLQGHFPGILKPKIKAMSSVIHKIVVPSNINIVIQAMNGP
jgi:hypothetical protein